MTANESSNPNSRSALTTGRVLLIIGLVTAGLYIISLWTADPLLGMLMKGVPVLMMIVWLFLRSRDRYANLIMIGLVASLVGDLLLQFSKNLFVAGLLAFLIAHLIYIAAFLGVAREGRWVRLAPFAVWGLVAFVLLNPYLGSMVLPVAAYITVIVVMMWRAAAMVGTPAVRGKSQNFEWAALLGAIAFGLSDTLLAFNKFVWNGTLLFLNVTQPAPFVDTLSIILYWLGQLGIMLSASWEATDRARSAAASS